MNKLPLPARFSDGVVDYSLVYIPNLPADADPRYGMEPNVSRMHCIARNSQQVTVSDKGKMVFSYVVMQQPPIPGTTTPARQYLFFRLSDRPIPFDLLQPGNMICYAATPKHQSTDPAQGFVDSLFGTVAEESRAQAPKETWASDLFQPPAPESGEEAQEEDEGVPVGEVSHE